MASSESDLFLVVLSGLGSDQLDILSSVVVVLIEENLHKFLKFIQDQ